MKKDNGKYTVNQKFKYWFDKQMAKGTGKLIRILAIATIIVVIIIALLISIFGLKEEGGFSAALWDSFATTINAWMPYSDEGGPGYILLTSVSAVIGLLFTSVLIGIVSTAIEEKFTQLRKGTSPVVERNHTVILGFIPGEYTIISELINAAGKSKRCIVVAADMENDEMSDLIAENVEIPSNVSLICRKADITDPLSIGCCGIPEARNVVIAYGDDAVTVRAVLAVGKVLDKAGAKDGRVKVIAAVSDEKYMLPQQLREKNNIVMIHTGDMVSRIIARSCTQPGISHILKDVFCFEGFEFYSSEFPKWNGKTFDYLVKHVRGGIPVGFLTEGRCQLNPPSYKWLRPGDKLIYYAEERGGIRLDANAPETCGIELCEDDGSGEKSVSLLVIGFNELFETLNSELPELVSNVVIAPLTGSQNEQALAFAAENERVTVTDAVLESMLDASDDDIEALVSGYDHIVLLSDHGKQAEEADMETVLCLIRLKFIKKHFGLSYSITTEMITEKNRDLVKDDDMTEFIVASDFVSLALAQMTENSELYELFEDLLSDAGSEFWLKPAKSLGIPEAPLRVSEIRNFLFANKGSIFVGYFKADDGAVVPVMNPDPDSVVTLSSDDMIVVICE